MKRNLVMASLLALGVAAPAVAQNKGTIELGAFVKFTDYDNSYGTARKSANSWGGGGRLGYFFSSKWALELDGSANATDVIEFFDGFESTALTYYPFHLRLLFNQKLGSNSPFTWILGAGPGYNRYGKEVAGEPGFKGDDWGVGALTGFRAMLTNWLAFRVDGTLDYIPSPNNGSAVQVPKLLENILKLDFDTAIAGRGEPMTKADVQAYKVKWVTFMGRARDAMKKGVSKEEFMANVKQDDLGWNFNAGFFNNLYDELKANP